MGVTSRSKAIHSFLIKAGADVNAVNSNGQTIIEEINSKKDREQYRNVIELISSCKENFQP